MVRRTCKLCLNEADLQRSHYVGKALYRLSSADGELPILASRDLIIQDQKQIADYVLCRVCERRFSDLGENYVMKMVNLKDSFKMMELIRANPIRRAVGDYTVYRAADMGIDTNALAYFALSIIWRGGAHIWRTFGDRGTGGLQLGHHEERLRRYLSGSDPFPMGVAVKVSVASDYASQNVVLFPRANVDQPDATVFTFAARGIWFDVVVGDDLPKYLYENCCVSSPDKLIYLGDFERFVMYELRLYRQTATVRHPL